MPFAPKRRWPRFSLRTMFVGVTVFCWWMGYELNFIHQRRAMRESIVQRGGAVEVFSRPEPLEIFPGILHSSYQRVLGPEEEPEIPRWRRWLGDESINQVMMPVGSSKAEVARAKWLFPESAVDVFERTSGGGMF